jgi:L-pipecolate oxidase
MLAPAEDGVALPGVYRAGTRRLAEATPLTRDADADTVIIGAGFTGLSAALHLAEAGRKVVVLEAREIGWGASGRNFGQVVPYTKHSEAHVLSHFGPVYGPRLLEATAKGPDLVFELIEKHNIPCSSVRNGLLFAAHSPTGLQSLERRADYWGQRGAPVKMLDRSRTAALIGSDVYRSALLERRGGTLNPLAYAHGLAAAAVRAGATLHIGARVTELAPIMERWRAVADGGAVTASTAIVATDAYTDGFAPQIRKALIPMRAYQLVSKPLGENVRKTILPQGQSLTDTRRLFSGVRLHEDGRLHCSMDGPAFSRGRPFLAKLNRRVRKLYPHLGDIAWDEGWSGWVGMTADEYPQLVSAAPGCFSALGYSGRGIALATILGRELARHLTGTPEDELVLPLTAPKPISVRPFAAPLVGSLMTLYRVLDGVDERRLTKTPIH